MSEWCGGGGGGVGGKRGGKGRVQTRCDLCGVATKSQVSLPSHSIPSPFPSSPLLPPPLPSQIVSQAPATGTVRVIADLADIQGQEFSSPTILIAEKVGGMEDIPANVQVGVGRWEQEFVPACSHARVCSP